MNTFVNAINGIKNTENGATAYSTTGSAVYDLFALGGAYRQREDSDCINLFKNAFYEDGMLALKCLAYLRDCRGGQGERRFARTCLKWLADNHAEDVRLNIKLIPEYGRWDDLYALYGTKCWNDAMNLIHDQLLLDLDCKTPSLLAKWLKSENASSVETKRLATATREAMGLTPKTYRRALSLLRERINVLERLMSSNQWDKIEFDKIPSKAGLIYKNAFARRDIIKEKYREFAMDDSTKVNAKTLYPYEIANKAMNCYSDTDNAMLNKYWNNLPDYTGDRDANVLVMADTSGSMTWGCGSVKPIDMSVALAIYFADKQKGAFKNHFMTFESQPHFVTLHGDDIVRKVQEARRADWGGSTNLVGAFREILKVAVKNHVPAKDMPRTLMVISDMEIDEATEYEGIPEMDGVRMEFERNGYELPHIVYWNVNARNDTVLDRAEGVTCVSGCSPVIFEQVMSGKTGREVMMDKLNSERYSAIQHYGYSF